ncbi:MAG: sugar phosphate isomerase family [Planctomycetota bacterium]|jgi:DeoR/GlpR family transcriptional regulator of sugar metabolism
MKKRKIKEQRASALWEILRKRIGRRITFNDLAEQRAAVGDKVATRTIQSTLMEMRKDPRIPGTKLIVGKTDVRLKYSEQTVLDTRESFRTKTKQDLGKLPWEILFNVDLRNDNNVGFELNNVTDILKDKIDGLRQKASVICWIDAGTTTKAVVQNLLNRGNIPFEILIPQVKMSDAEAQKGLSTHRTGLINIDIVTNSPPIEELIRKSKHRSDINVILVGGEERPERASICGLLTQQCLDRWNLYGDVAIIGTTGYRSDFSGIAKFGCDNAEEARLKQSFLRRAQLRVLIFDSSKLISLMVSKPFAALAAASIDLVITDDGWDYGCQSEVVQLCEKAKEVGVTTAVLTKKK